MPELPDLEYIRPILCERLQGCWMTGVEVFEPVVVRNLTGMDLSEFSGIISSVTRLGPFLRFSLKPRDRSALNSEDQLEIVMHPMLAGRFRLSGKKQAVTAFRMNFDDFHLDFLDDKKMGKVYLGRTSDLHSIPGFASQGTDILSPSFDWPYFQRIAAKSRKQARVFLMDQKSMSAIGNAYADEVLFEARIHPKTRMNQLDESQLATLFESIRSVIQDGIRTIQEAKPDLEMKYRDHMKVRNKKDQPCIRCGNKIRRANVNGYDSFFCPVCQPDGGKGFIDWTTVSR